MTEVSSPYITGGHVRITQRKRLGDFEHREVEAILSFNTAEGDHRDIFDQAAREVCRQINDMQDDATKRGPGRPPGAVNKATRGQVKGDVKVDFNVPALKTEDPPVDPPTEPVAPTPDPAAMVEVDEDASPPITDEVLKQALAHTMQRLIEKQVPDPAGKIKAVIFVHAQRATEIPQEQRREFLDKLGAL